jgi:hypothetical protein
VFVLEDIEGKEKKKKKERKKGNQAALAEEAR